MGGPIGLRGLSGVLGVRARPRFWAIGSSRDVVAFRCPFPALIRVCVVDSDYVLLLEYEICRESGVPPQRELETAV